MASAAERTFASSIELAHTFHEFHPSGGVRASLCCPAMIVSCRDVLPRGPSTVIVATYSPACSMLPEMMPVFESSDRPAGSPSAENFSGPSPVAGIRNRKSCPGVAPVTRGPWMAGSGPSPEAISGAGSSGKMAVSG